MPVISYTNLGGSHPTCIYSTSYTYHTLKARRCQYVIYRIDKDAKAWYHSGMNDNNEEQALYFIIYMTPDWELPYNSPEPVFKVDSYYTADQFYDARARYQELKNQNPNWIVKFSRVLGE